MAPEQLRGGAVDHRADLWALGVVLYQALTGRLPFEADHQAAVMAAILNTDAPGVGATRPDTPPALRQIVSRLLKKDPGARYGSALEVRQELETCRQQLTAPVRPEATNAVWQALWRPRVAGAAGATLLAAVAVGG